MVGKIKGMSTVHRKRIRFKDKERFLSECALINVDHKNVENKEMVNKC